MFYTSEKLKLNGFKKVVLPNNKDLFSRCGKRDSSFVGSDESLPMSFNKLDGLELIDNLDRNRLREEAYKAYSEQQNKLDKLDNTVE